MTKRTALSLLEMTILSKHPTDRRIGCSQQFDCWIFKRNIALLVAITAIFSGLLGQIISFDFAFATSEEEGGNNGDGVDDGDDGGRSGDEHEADPRFAGDPGSQPSIDPCEENQEAEGCAPELLVDLVTKIRKQKNVCRLILASKILLQRDVNLQCVHVQPEREKIALI